MLTLDSDLWNYFLNASPVVKCVMVLLAGASVFSWSYILQRSFVVNAVRKATEKFELKFWAGGDLSKMYADTSHRKDDLQGMESIFHAGFKEFLRLHKQPRMTAEAVVESAQRAMRVAYMYEQDRLEAGLPVLATVGSTSPYVGLFGTVWGIMLSFKALATVQQATVSMVAPGIAEALIATAMGLFAAIPAVVAYNRFSTQMGRLLNRFDAFQDDFSNVLFRQAQVNTSKTESHLETTE